MSSETKLSKLLPHNVFRRESRRLMVINEQPGNMPMWKTENCKEIKVLNLDTLMYSYLNVDLDIDETVEFWHHISEFYKEIILDKG